MNIKALLFFWLLLWAGVACAESVTVPIYQTNGGDKAKHIGQVRFIDSRYGLLIYPNLRDLPPGLHGFHIHEHPNCANKGLAAGDHFDPNNTNKHRGPYANSGHRGDLPALCVGEQGRAVLPVLAPRLKVSMLKGHAVIVHAGGDNYSDTPKLGGGGARIACGVVK